MQLNPNANRLNELASVDCSVSFNDAEESVTALESDLVLA